MGKASNAKKVNRAAATGGGRTAGNRTPVLWYTTIFFVVVIGAMLVFTSASNLRDKDAASADTPPLVNKDHWHAAYGFFLCGSWAQPLQDQAQDSTGIHTHADGLIHTHPFVPSAAGKNATLGKFLELTKAKVTATSIDLKRDGEKYKNGDKCGKKKGEVMARVFKSQADKEGKELVGNPSTWRIKNGELIAIGFAPEGTKLEQPPSAANLSDPGDLGSTPSPSDVTPTTTPATAPPTSTPPTSAP